MISSQMHNNHVINFMYISFAASILTYPCTSPFSNHNLTDQLHVISTLGSISHSDSPVIHNHASQMSKLNCSVLCCVTLFLFLFDIKYFYPEYRFPVCIFENLDIMSDPFRELYLLLHKTVPMVTTSPHHDFIIIVQNDM